MKINELEQEVQKWSQKVEELETEYSNLGDNVEETIVKEKLGDLYSTEEGAMRERREEIIDKVGLMEDDERLVVGNFLYDQRILSFCSGGFGGYKRPTDCGGCHLGEKNVEKLGLEKYVTFYGDRVYGIPNEVVDKAKIRLSEESGLVERGLSDVKSVIGGLKSEIREKNEQIDMFKKLDSNSVDYEKVEAEMPGLREQLASKHGDWGDMKSNSHVKGINFVETDNFYVVAAIWDDHTYSMRGNGGIQWKNWTTVHYREKESEGEIRQLSSPEVVTRHRFSADYDRRDLWPFTLRVGLEAEGNKVKTSWMNSDGEKRMQMEYNLEEQK